MEPITSWSEERVTEWLQGLDAPLNQYPVNEWHLSGRQLLQLTPQCLEKLGVHKVGHQELVLEAVEKLCSLTYDVGGENLQGLTEKLKAVAYTLQTGIQTRWRLHNYDGNTTTKLPAATLQVVVELITSAKGLFSLFNRYQFLQPSGQTPTKNIFGYCRELREIVHKPDTTVYEKEKDIISVCRQLVAVCDEVLKSSPPSILIHTPQLESVDLVPASPGEQLGIEITSTSSNNHYVTGAAAEPSTDAFLPILTGDEVVQVNEQIVVGWSRTNLIKKLQENPSGVTLVLKKISVSQDKDSAHLLSSQKQEEEREKRSEEEKIEEENPRHSVFERVAASVRSLSFRRAIQGPETQPPTEQEESESSSDKEQEKRLSVTSDRNRQGRLSPVPASAELGNTRTLSLSQNSMRDQSPSFRSPSPLRLQRERASVSSCPDMRDVGHPADKETKKSSTKGQTTALSRRRVSCRELSHPDCDGWLSKKKKETSVFLTQKWERYWFVLKAPSLYWYKSQQDEKAEGLLNVCSYSIESAGSHKRKYVFQMCHKKFQNFIFAADTVNDMSKWINALITAIQKHSKLLKDPKSEEECYSETESESETSPPRRRNKKLQANTLPRPKDKTNKAPSSASPAESGKGTKGGPVDEMGRMFNNLKEGGVSLIGNEQPLTQDHFRRSFIRRNKNPVINEKAHTLRALQSTLKAREAELQQINKLLDDSELTASKFHQWKENNEELVKEIEKRVAQKSSKAPAEAAPVRKDTPDKEVALETVATETAAAEADEQYKLSLSDGEQLVDAEPSDVLLEMQRDSDGTEENPDFEVSLGSLQDSITRELSERAESGDYFYI